MTTASIAGLIFGLNMAAQYAANIFQTSLLGRARTGASDIAALTGAQERTVCLPSEDFLNSAADGYHFVQVVSSGNIHFIAHMNDIFSGNIA